MTELLTAGGSTFRNAQVNLLVRIGMIPDRWVNRYSSVIVSSPYHDCLLADAWTYTEYRSKRPETQMQICGQWRRQEQRAAEARPPPNPPDKTSKRLKCSKFGKLIRGKISEIVATKSYMLKKT